MTELKSLDLFNCEVTNLENYREKSFELLKDLQYLDGYDRENQEAEEDEDEDGEDGIDGEDEDDEEDGEGESEGMYLWSNWTIQQGSHRPGKILKTFSSQGFFSQNQGKKFQTVWLCEEVLLINWCFCKHCPNGKWRPRLKRINVWFFLTKMPC